MTQKASRTHSSFRIASLRLAILAVILAHGVAVHAKPDEVSEDRVQTCRYLDRVQGSSGYGKNQDWRGIAKAVVVRKAAGIGASHIVWDRISQAGVFNGTAEARAYSCAG